MSELKETLECQTLMRFAKIFKANMGDKRAFANFQVESILANSILKTLGIDVDKIYYGGKE